MAKAKILPGIALTTCLGFLGMIAGGFIGGWIGQGVGWDALGDALGGAMLGIVAGLLGGLLLTSRLRVEILRRVAWTALAIALVVLGTFYVLSRLDRPQETPPVEVAPKPTVPAQLIH